VFDAEVCSEHNVIISVLSILISPSISTPMYSLMQTRSKVYEVGNDATQTSISFIHFLNLKTRGNCVHKQDVCCSFLRFYSKHSFFAPAKFRNASRTACRPLHITSVILSVFNSNRTYLRNVFKFQRYQIHFKFLYRFPSCFTCIDGRNLKTFQTDKRRSQNVACLSVDFLFTSC
jgi:hypothetical protein